MFSDRGILISGYGFFSPYDFDRLPLPDKFAASRNSIERLHPGHGRELEKPIYVGWHRVPWNEGSWIATYGPGQAWEPDNPLGSGYATLIQPDGPIYFIGDHTTHILGWQEGAALSSLRAIRMLTERLRALHTASSL